MRHKTGESFSLRLSPNVLLLLVILWITSDVGEGATEHVCRKNIDIRNDVKDFHKLQGCTVIEGSLQILLIDYAEPVDYESLSFPLLREITDYLLLYRVFGLRSLAKIFPNLSVIRGQRLFFNYALVAFEMVNLEDIALPNLTTILRGGVRLEKNSNLCYVDTIDWSLIAHKAGPEDNFIMQNKDIDKCVNRCPRNEKGEGLCRRGPSRAKALCWNSEHCQLVCPQQCGNKACYRDASGLHCCHGECIGGCTGPSVKDCAACKNFFLQDKCVKRCPPATYVYKDRRCITEKECQDMEEDRQVASDQDTDTAWKLFYNRALLRNECIRECPSGFTTDDQNRNKCKPCDGPCPRSCIPVPVDSVAAAQKLKGCTVIKGYLQIHITGGSNVGSELENNLGSIEEVTHYVKIDSSFALVSLSFLRSLTVIRGKQLRNDRYALFVLDNQNLQEIWDWKVHPNLTIINGLVFFNQNRKLCLSKIHELVDRVGMNGQVDKLDISDINNGDQAACDMKNLDLKMMQIQHDVVIITWSSFKADDVRKLLHYVVYYREAPEKNITIWNARDACSNDVWKTMDVPPGDGDQDIGEIIHDLKPFTQYAIYVQTYTIASAQQGAISPIEYVTTKPWVPTNPRNVEVKAKSPNELVVTWEPPSKPNGNVTHYYVYWSAQSLSMERLDQRNYCVDKIHGSLLGEEKMEEEEDKMKMNITYDGKYCCACPPSDEEFIAQENDRQFQIKFEDFLHDSVYVKRPANMKDNNIPFFDDLPIETAVTTRTPPRYRRDVNIPNHNLLDARPGVNSSFLLGNLSLSNMTNTTDMYDSPDNHMQYHATVVYGKTMITLSNLPHFTEYSIEVIACHEVEEGQGVEEKKCSNRAITTGRTLPLDGADNVNHRNITVDLDSSDSSAVFISWPNPTLPNGLIVTYELKYQQIGKDFQPVIKCIAHLQYRELGGYKLTKLNPGNYSMQIRATSLAGNGSWTEAKYFVISARMVSNSLTTEVIAAIAASCALITVFVVSLFIWVYAKKRFNAAPDRVQYASFNPEYQTVYVPDEWEVVRGDVTVGKELGQGSFGMVYEGLAKELLCGKEEIKVAIKTVMEGATQRDRMEFLNEASVMKGFVCNHVVRLLGVVSVGAPTLVIMELMANGDLKNYLRSHRPEENPGCLPPTLKEILKIAGEICDGMVYLSSKKFVHRDLAARNCMVAEDKTVKIGDFGMTRDVYETDYYRKGGKGLLPVRWMAPESLKDGRFTSQSDVWSYGVVLWEMATLAAQPYQGLSNEQVLNYVKDGGIMEQPVGCPDCLYEIMLETWRHSPKNRPTFCEILEALVPNLDESFKDDAYFFSEENQQERLMAKAKQDAIVIQAHEEEEEEEEDEGNKDLYNDSYAPLTGSAQRLEKHKESNGPRPPPEPLRVFKHNQPNTDYTRRPPSSGYMSTNPSTSGYMSTDPSTSAGAPHPPPPSYSSSFHLPHQTPHSSLYSHPTTNSGSGNPPPPVGQPVGRNSPPNSRTLPVPAPSSPPKPKADSISRSPSSDESKESSKSSGGSVYAPVNGMANGHLPRPYVARQAKC